MTKAHFIIAIALFLGISVNAQELFMTKLGTDRAQQGMAAWGRRIYSLEDGGKVNVYPFRKGERNPAGNFCLESSCKENHANNAEFGIEKIKGAAAPLLYVSVGKPGSSMDWTCHVESISKKGGQWKSTLVQRLQLDTTQWASKGYSAIFGAPSCVVKTSEHEGKWSWMSPALSDETVKAPVFEMLINHGAGPVVDASYAYAEIPGKSFRHARKFLEKRVKILENTTERQSVEINGKTLTVNWEPFTLHIR
ncbi:MAG: hypothetical protein J6T02_04000 [Bacteroidales bacterium]|nr:hypothetical protein [Bacteroidales bacterium]